MVCIVFTGLCTPIKKKYASAFPFVNKKFLNLNKNMGYFRYEYPLKINAGLNINPLKALEIGLYFRYETELT